MIHATLHDRRSHLYLWDPVPSARGQVLGVQRLQIASRIPIVWFVLVSWIVSGVVETLFFVCVWVYVCVWWCVFSYSWKVFFILHFFVVSACLGFQITKIEFQLNIDRLGDVLERNSLWTLFDFLRFSLISLSLSLFSLILFRKRFLKLLHEKSIFVVRSDVAVFSFEV